MSGRGVRLVGRTDELRTLVGALAAARDGAGRALFLVGGRGAGKSLLAAVAGDLATGAAMPTLQGRCSVIGPPIALRPLREALVTVGDLLSPQEVAELGPHRRALTRLASGSALPGPTGSAGSPGPDPLAFGEGILRLTGLAGRGRGCLLVLEDLHDADGETLAILDYLVDHLRRQPVTLVGTLRADAGPALDLVRAAARRGACRVVELRPLGPDDLRRLAAVRLGVHPDELPGSVPDLLRAGSGGNPELAGGTLGELLDAGALRLTPTGWRVTTPVDVPVPSLSRPVTALAPRQRDLLLLGALLGPSFSRAVLRRATGRPDRDVRDDLCQEAVARLVRPDRSDPDRYTFVHPLVRDALRATVDPAARRVLARRAAEAVAAAHPDGPPCPWTLAALWHDAGAPAAAGRVLATAGRSAYARGAAQEAARLLGRAATLLAEAEAEAEAEADGLSARAAVLEDLIDALTEAGSVDRALGQVTAVDALADRLDPARRARLHTALARAAGAAGHVTDGLRHVEVARALVGPDARDADTAPIDVAAAQLAAQTPDRSPGAEAAARRAVAVAARAALPDVAFRADLLLGELTRAGDPAAATVHLTRAWSVAVHRHVPLWELHATLRLGDDDALRTGDLERLNLARRTAGRVGATSARHEAESRLALHAVLRGEFATAELLTERLLADTVPAGQLRLARHALLVRATAAAHQGRPRAMVDALGEHRRHGGDPARHASWIHGLARVFVALLREDRARALHESHRAARADLDDPIGCPLAGRHGLHLLLRAVTGDLDPPPETGPTAAPVGRLRWNHHFHLLAGAVLAGRAGRTEQARAAVDEAQRVAAPYPVARHLGLRLVSEAAMVDGWGEPVGWLRVAEEHFHRADVPEVAAACRRLLRRAGSRSFQRRAGVDDVPAGLRARGVTPREYEVLRLLAERLSNREIAERLHLSARTVEKHVASLLAKTGQPDRIAVGRLAPTDDGPG
ncbi:AAA family ATPase [Micromonospora sp. WMMD882]|uniref:helix-turn-helix transcriptional regulator n=1 Tax=Micromonospora sp. WMMD882 TaxID=3015151 RepID=UPI00248CDAAE|nr:LuxR family transcriptional regulator [Micromonospora sp. WMMD882]WBB80754.1 AAA family ATPase [Micromonospora sp. WMMD882]